MVVTLARMLFAALLTAQAPGTNRYLVTTAPIHVVGISGRGFCIGVDPTDPQGVWWWEPGRSECRSRSTGPGVFHADNAKVSVATQSGTIEVGFQLQSHRPVTDPRRDLDVHLTIRGGRMRTGDSDEGVPVQRRNDLEMPEEPPYGRGRRALSAALQSAVARCQ